MADGVVVVARLRARREEIVQAIFARVREVVPDSVGDRDVEYAAGLRATAAAGFDFILRGIGGDKGGPRLFRWRRLSRRAARRVTV